MEIEIRDKGRELTDGTVALVTRMESFGNHRKVNSNEVEVDADKELIKVSKTLVDSDELKAVLRIGQIARNYIANKCLPYVAGIHLLPMALVPEVDQKLLAFKKQRDEAVDKFIEVYPELCKEAEERLRGLYNPGDYPSATKLRATFSFEWQYVGFGPPGSLKRVSSEIFKAEQEKTARIMSEAAEEIQEAMRLSLSSLVERLKEALEPATDGKPKRLHKSAVAKLNEFLANFDVRNVLGDGDLKTEVDKLRSLMSGVSAEQIRSQDALRDSLRINMKDAAETLSKMVEAAPRRKMRKEEPEEAPTPEPVAVEF